MSNTNKNTNNNLNTDSEVNVRIRILNQMGDETLEMKLDKAIATVVKEHFSQGRFAYVGKTPFVFTANENDPVGLMQDTMRLRELLKEGDVLVTLTGDLRGGNR